MDRNKHNANKFGITSFVCGIAATIISILMYVCNKEALAYIFLVSGFILAVSAIIFANLASRREPQNKIKTAGFVLGVITLIICMSMVWFIWLLSCLGTALYESY